MTYILYNPRANNGHGKQDAETALETMKEKGKFIPEKVEFIDIIEKKDIIAFVDSLNEEDCAIICGGDGTLNHFANDLYSAKITADKIKCSLKFLPCGSGNDFMHDTANVHVPEQLFEPIELKQYLLNLPAVTVNGKTQYFINGIGFGIDGYCCEEGDRIRTTSTKPINYTAIAIKGLLFKFKPCSAKVTVDGKSYTFKKVWLAPTMKGRFYGGGMKIAPEQNRLAEDRQVSLVVFHNSGKLRTLVVFPSIFTGMHVEHKDLISIFKGQHIAVEFSKPCALQIDGETVPNVIKYSVSI
jgi:diacylglycerol kinase family enzyme